MPFDLGVLVPLGGLCRVIRFRRRGDVLQNARIPWFSAAHSTAHASQPSTIALEFRREMRNEISAYLP